MMASQVFVCPCFVQQPRCDFTLSHSVPHLPVALAPTQLAIPDPSHCKLVSPPFFLFFPPYILVVPDVVRSDGAFVISECFPHVSVDGHGSFEDFGAWGFAGFEKWLVCHSDPCFDQVPGLMFLVLNLMATI